MKHETNDILGSLDGMEHVPMPAALRERILAAIPARKAKTIFLRRPTILLMAAGLALLIGFNVYSLAAHRSVEKAGGAMATVANPLADEYFTPAPAI